VLWSEFLILGCSGDTRVLCAHCCINQPKNKYGVQCTVYSVQCTGGFIKGILRGVRCTKSLRVLLVGSLKMNTTLEYSTGVVQEGDRRCKKSTLNDLAYLTPLRIPLMNPVSFYIDGPPPGPLLYSTVLKSSIHH
jgi:hypothetical protein